MHALCYFRTDNIDITGPFPLPEYHSNIVEYLSELEQVKRHSQIDELEKKILRNSRIHTAGHKMTIRDRKIRIANKAASILRDVQDQAFRRAKREAFIGPLTIQMENGHPF